MTIPVDFNTIYGNLLLPCKYDDIEVNLTVGDCTIDLSVAILFDKRSTVQSNESSDSKHQVNPDTLEIASITINHEYLRILWTFVETDGSKRYLCGNLYKTHNVPHTNNYRLTRAESFRVCW